MKRYFQILFGGSLLSFLAVQSHGAVTIGNSGGNVADTSWTRAHWATSQLSGGKRLAYDQNDVNINPGTNDIFTFTVAAGLGNTGTLTMVDLGSPAGDVYSLDQIGVDEGFTATSESLGGFAKTTVDPTVASADSDYAKIEWSDLGPGTYSFTVENTASSISQGGIALRFSAIPEPSVGLLSLVGMLGLALRRRR